MSAETHKHNARQIVELVCAMGIFMFLGFAVAGAI